MKWLSPPDQINTRWEAFADASTTGRSEERKRRHAVYTTGCVWVNGGGGEWVYSITLYSRSRVLMKVLWINMFSVSYQRKLDPKNISLRLFQTLPDLRGWTHTQAISAAHTPYQCNAVGGWSGLCGPSCISASSPGRLSQPRLPPCSRSPGHGLPGGLPPVLPWTPAKLLTPPWVVPLHAALAGPRLASPPPPPPFCGSLGSRKQPRCVPNVELHWESVSVASYIFTIREDVDGLYFWGCWKTEKWEKNVCMQRHLYLVCIWICVYIFACFFELEVSLMVD